MPLITDHIRSTTKVMFSDVSVLQSTGEGGVGSPCQDPVWGGVHTMRLTLQIPFLKQSVTWPGGKGLDHEPHDPSPSQTE